MNYHQVSQTRALTVVLCSVERILAYTTAYEAEKPAIIPHKRPPADWPSRGQITLDSLVVRYRPDLAPVLKGLSLNIKAGEKVRPQLEAWALVPLPAPSWRGTSTHACCVPARP